MTIMISFPFGATQALPLRADTVIALAHTAQQFVSAEKTEPLIDLLNLHQIPLIHHPGAVRQLTAGLGIGYPERIDTVQAERVAKSVGNRITGKKSISLYDFQVDFAHVVNEAMRKAIDPRRRWSPENPSDRGYLISPWQTGKSLMSVTFAEHARRYFPGKKTLVIAPFNVAKKQMRSDFENYFSGTVSVVDDAEKDLSGDVILAMAYSLKNLITSENPKLPKLDPKSIGLVVIDEMPCILTSTWQQIMNYLGFVNERGEILQTQRKFALGLGASAEREDGRHVRQFFGKTMLEARGINWFIDHGYMHDVIGLEASYGKSSADWEEIEDQGENLVVMRNTPENRLRLIQTYRDNFQKGDKILVFVERVQHAHDQAKDFNEAFGEGYAAAVTSMFPDGGTWMTDEESDKILDAYNEGTGPKVLVSVRKIAWSFRARNTKGVIHGSQGSSWSLFAQRSCRALARQPGEPQRKVLIVTMEGKGRSLERAQSTATLVGVFEKPPRERVYHPRNLRKEKEGEGQGQGVRRANKRALLQVRQDQARSLKVHADQFGRAMQRALHDQFQGEIVSLAERSRLRLNDCNAYLHGMLPRTFAEVLGLERRLGLSYQTLTEPWLKDQMILLEGAYPLPDEMCPAQRELTRLYRGALLRHSKTGAVTGQGGEAPTNDSLLKAFRGEFPFQAEALRRYFDLIVDSGVADESDIRSAMGAYVHEMEVQGRQVRHPYHEHESDEFDHRHVDPLSTGLAVSLNSIPESRLPLAEHLLAASLYPFYAGLHTTSPVEIFTFLELSKQTRKVLARLAPREEEVVRMLFGIGEDEMMDVEEVGERLGVSGTRIYLLKKKALEVLRRPWRSISLKPFV